MQPTVEDGQVEEVRVTPTQVGGYRPLGTTRVRYQVDPVLLEEVRRAVPPRRPRPVITSTPTSSRGRVWSVVPTPTPARRVRALTTSTTPVLECPRTVPTTISSTTPPVPGVRTVPTPAPTTTLPESGV